jgi:beta-barrel assembly-enhancing protease
MTSLSAPARLYGGDSPATGEDAQVEIGGSELRVHAANQSLSCPLTAVRIREVGTGNLGLEFAWDADGRIHAVQIFDPAALNAIRSNGDLQALPQMAAFHASRRHRSTVRTLGWTALIVFLSLPILLILIFLWQADRIARAAAERISIEQEMSFGEQAFASMRGSLKLQDSGPAFEAVESIGARLTEGSKYRYRFHVAENDAINAFAVPGGIVVVHTGLIKATRRPEELAGVLAHEVQHVEQRHSLQALVKDLGLRGLWMLFTGDLGSGLVGQAALELTSLSFSRDAEAQADAKGFDELIEAGIDPSGMADFFTIMAKQEGAATPPPFLSTHPASTAREAALRAREEELRGKDFAPLALGAWPPVPFE